MSALFLVLVSAVLDAFVAHIPEGTSDGVELHAEKFSAFIQQHGRVYQPGSEEYRMRFAFFKDRLAAVDAQNRQTHRSWSAAVNGLADRTPEELARLRGYRHSARTDDGATSSVGLMGISTHTVDITQLPRDHTWKGHLQAMQDVHDQGSCGSCWAVASATVLRAHAELFQADRTFSVQQILACTPNPRACGGDGGCKGATAELAMDYVARVGLLTEDQMVYQAKDISCPADMQAPKRNLRTALKEVALPDMSIYGGGGASFGMVGWRKLPENKVEPLLLALYETGPVVVSVGANDVWNMYANGIMRACEQDAVINHAVALVGYGEQQGTMYWQIQNSWGAGWGEEGFARLLRLNQREEAGYCGWDKSPEVGTGCKGGPSKVYVCGSCGILYDSVVPKFVLSEHGWWARQGGRAVGAHVNASRAYRHFA